MAGRRVPQGKSLRWSDLSAAGHESYARMAGPGLIGNPAYPAKLRQPILMVAAGRDEVVSTPAIEAFASQLLAGSHLIIAGAKHEILQEHDHYRQQFWAAFDAFVPGTPMY